MQENGLSLKETQKRLRSRAEALALPITQVEDTTDTLTVVQFSLSQEVYAIETKYALEVLPLKELTVLPGVPDFVLGLVHVRGQIFSVVNLKKFFHLPEQGLGELNKLILLKHEQMEFAILTDAVLGVHSLKSDNIQKEIYTVTSLGATYVKGITLDRVILLDGEKLLTDEKMIVYEE